MFDPDLTLILFFLTIVVAILLAPRPRHAPAIPGALSGGPP